MTLISQTKGGVGDVPRGKELGAALSLYFSLVSKMSHLQMSVT